MFFLTKRDKWDPPSLRERIWTAPVGFLVSIAYDLTNRARWHREPQKPIRVVCISDTHTLTYDIPDGDLLIHAGDMTNRGTLQEIQTQIDWLNTLPHKHKIAISGNHDTYLDPRSRKTLNKEERDGQLDWGNIHYLQHGIVELFFHLGDRTRKLRVYGAPQVPKCGGNEFAFQYNREDDAWTGTIPEWTDVLVTHTPPQYHLDIPLENLGCRFLLREVWMKRPRLHVFGHCHAGAGREVWYWDEAQLAFEENSARPKVGFLWEILSPWRWLDLAKVLLYGIRGIVWSRVWGGSERCTLAVNAGLMYNNTGRLGNEVQIVEI